MRESPLEGINAILADQFVIKSKLFESDTVPYAWSCLHLPHLLDFLTMLWCNWPSYLDFLDIRMKVKRYSLYIIHCQVFCYSNKNWRSWGKMYDVKSCYQLIGEIGFIWFPNPACLPIVCQHFVLRVNNTGRDMLLAHHC